MNIQWKRVAMMAGLSTVLVLSGIDAFALGRSKKSGYRGWNQAQTDSNNGNVNVVADENPTGNDANPVPEPASLVLFGSALAGLGGYRGLRKRLTRKS